MGAWTATTCQTGTWANKAAYSYETDGVLSGLTQTLNGTTVTLGYGRNRSSQITGLTASDAFYAPTPTILSTAYTPNALNEYGAIAGQTLSSDNNGNLLVWYPVGGKQTYTYDSENRLSTAAVGGSTTATISYDYDGLGRRVTKTVGGVVTSYLLAGDEEVGEYSGATLLRRYVTGPGVDDRVAHAEGSATSNPAKTYYHTNHQGSVIAMTDGSGNLSQRISYDEYGNGAPATGEQFGYTGRRFDPETGLYYYRARYYSPQLGRFLQTDPVGYKDDVNLYAYVGNDPLDRTDPSGNSYACDHEACNVVYDSGSNNAEYFATAVRSYVATPTQNATGPGSALNDDNYFTEWEASTNMNLAVKGAILSAADAAIGERYLGTNLKLYERAFENQYARSFRLAGSFKFTGGLLLGLGTAVDLGRVRRHELTLGVAGRNFGFGAATFLGGPFVVIGVGYGLIDNFYTGGVDAFVDDSTRYYVPPKFPISPY